MPNSMHVHRDGPVGCFRGCCMACVCVWGGELYTTVSWKELIVVFVLHGVDRFITVYSSMLIFWDNPILVFIVTS